MSQERSFWERVGDKEKDQNIEAELETGKVGGKKMDNWEDETGTLSLLSYT